jgi:hypothetical protein
MLMYVDMVTALNTPCTAAQGVGRCTEKDRARRECCVEKVSLHYGQTIMYRDHGITDQVLIMTRLLGTMGCNLQGPWDCKPRVAMLKQL